MNAMEKIKLALEVLRFLKRNTSIFFYFSETHAGKKRGNSHSASCIFGQWSSIYASSYCSSRNSSKELDASGLTVRSA